MFVMLTAVVLVLGMCVLLGLGFGRLGRSFHREAEIDATDGRLRADLAA
jgi:hypothetical protein